MKNTSQHIYLYSTETYREYRQLKCLKDVSDKVFPLLKVFFGWLSLTSVKVQDTARPFLSTWGRLIISFPPWKSTREGSCFERGEVLTLYLRRKKANIACCQSLLQLAQRNSETPQSYLLFGYFTVTTNVHFAKFQPCTVVPEWERS